MPTAVIYARVSTEDQARKGFSLPEQLEECRRKARALGATDVLEFWDDVSGEILDRPGLTAAREVIRRGGITWFVCLAADRFARNLAHQLLVADEIKRRGVELVFTQHGYDNTPEGKFFFSIFGAVAELEKAKIAERTARGRRGKLKTGRLPGYIDVYGYQFNPETDLLDVLSAEAEWVRRIYTWAVEEQLGAYSIRDRLNDMRVPAPRGEQWNVATVKNILRNPTYTGKLTLGRRSWSGYSLNKHRPAEEKVSPTWRDQSEWVVIDVPAVVDTATFYQAQEIVNRRRGIKPKTARLLSGLMVCGLCGGKLHYKPHTKRAGGRMYYYIYCTNKFASYARSRNHPPEQCTLRTIPAWRLEEHVMQTVESWLREPEALQDARARFSETTPDSEPLQAELDDVEAQLSTIRGEHARLIQMVTMQLARLDDVQKGLAQRLAAIERLEARSAEIRTRIAVAPVERPAIDFSAFRDMVDERLADITPDLLAQVVQRAVRQITVFGPTPEEWDVIPY